MAQNPQRKRSMLFEAVYNYGRVEFLPVNDEAKAIAVIAKKKHLSKANLEALITIGHRVTFTQDCLNRLFG